MAKKGNRVQVILECTEHKNKIGIKAALKDARLKGFLK